MRHLKSIGMGITIIKDATIQILSGIIIKSGNVKQNRSTC